MPEAISPETSLIRLSGLVRTYVAPIAAAASALLGAGLSLGIGAAGQLAVAAGAALASLAVIGSAVAALAAGASRRRKRSLLDILGPDPAGAFAVHASGEAWFTNEAGVQLAGAEGADALVLALARLNARPGALVRRLHAQARTAGSAVEDLVQPGARTRVTVTRFGDEDYVWRIESIPAAAHDLDHALREGVPALLYDASGAVLDTSAALDRLLARHPETVGQVLPGGLPKFAELAEVDTVDGPLSMRAVNVARGDGGGVLCLIPHAPWADVDGGVVAAGIEALPVGLIQVGPQGLIISANRIARDLLRSTCQGGLEGTRVSDRLEGLGRPIMDWLEAAARGQGLGRPEVLRLRVEDAEIYLQVTLGRLEHEGEVRLLAVLNDATELKTLEAQVVQSQKMQAIGQLAGGIAHDFNNLLTAISGHCDLLLLRHDHGDPEYGDLVQIHQNANRAASLVGQLLAFSRKQTLQPQVIDLRETLSDLTHLLNRLVGERVSLTFHHEAGLPRVRADKRQLEQVVMNLVVNARDAMPSGGEIRVHTMERTLGNALHRDRATVPPGRYVVVKVEDHGTGIPADKLSKIFEPFYTTKRTGEGTGLGLSTAYGIVKQSGGFIFVDSAVGSGTVFTLYFPAHEGPVEQVADQRLGSGAQSALRISATADAVRFGQAPPKPVPLSEPSGGGEVTRTGATASASDAITGSNAAPRSDGVILLVEDEAPVRAFASRALRMRGYTVIEAESAEEALQTLEDADLAVDVFVTDVVMPGLDGPTWVREALKTRPDVKVVFVSGYAEDCFEDGQTVVPNSVFLPKPFSLGELTATVQAQFA